MMGKYDDITDVTPVKNGASDVISDKDINPVFVEAWKQLDNARKRIEAHWETLGGRPGAAISEVENIGEGYRIRYKGSAIYTGLQGTAWVYGDIGKRYELLGGALSWLGLPMKDEQSFSDGGRVSVFEHGSIYWWPDTGAIELNEVVVHYTGLICFGETNENSPSDEPYVLFGLVGPQTNVALRSRVYDDVDGGEDRPDLLELYRGQPYGLNITTILMEQDYGDPDVYKASLHKAVEKAGEGLAALLGLIPGAGPALAVAAEIAMPSAVGPVTSALNEWLDTGDDQLGEFTHQMTAKQMVVLAARTNNSTEKHVGYKLATPLISAQSGSYKVYYGIVPA